MTITGAPLSPRRDPVTALCDDPSHGMAPVTAGPATLIVWFHLRSPDLSAEFERVMADDRNVAFEALDTVSDWRLTRPVNVPGQPSEPADYVLIAEITEVDRWTLQATEQVQRLADELGHLISARGMLVVERVL
jgi:hypothetical protein